MTVNDLSYAKINSVNLLYLIVDKINEYIGQNSGNEYLKLISSDESKNRLKKYKKLWNKIGDLIRSRTNNSDNFDEKYIKSKLNLDGNLPLKKTPKCYDMVIVVRSVFHENGKSYPQVFLDKCL